MVDSAAEGSSPDNCKSKSRRRALGAGGNGVPGAGRRARAASRSPCSARMRARRSEASGLSGTCWAASFAASSSLPWLASTAARRSTASEDPRSHGPSRVFRASSGRPAASWARASSSPSSFFPEAGDLRSASCSGVMAVCGMPSRSAASAFSTTVEGSATAVEASTSQSAKIGLILGGFCGGIARSGSRPFWPRSRAVLPR